MDNEKAKKAAELAELELQKEEEQQQIDLIKKAIRQTLEAIKSKEKDRDKLNKEIKTLKQDIDNIRAGRLDLIAERQEKDEEAKRTSVIEIVREIHHHHYERWYEPYKITWNPYWNQIYCDSVDMPVTTYGSSTYGTFGNTSNTYTLTNSIAKDSYAGTYQLECGDCVTLT